VEDAKASSPQEAGKLPIAAVLGLKPPPDGDWVRLRGIQAQSVSDSAQLRGAVHLVLAALAAWIFFPTSGALLVGGWFGLIAALSQSGVQLDIRLARSDHRKQSMSAFRSQASMAAALGFAWAIPMLLFAATAPLEAEANMWGITALLMFCSIFFYLAAPVGYVAFALTFGLLSAFGMARGGHYEVAVIAVIFTAIGLSGSVEIARTYVRAFLAQSGNVEKDQVVSLLLREFEENEADWLWQTDTTRRIRAVSPRFAYALGQAQGEAEGKPLMEMIAGRHWESGKFPPSLHDLAERLKSRESFSNLIVEVSIRGEQRWWELSGTPMRDERGNFSGFRGVGSDVTSQRESSEKIAYLARFDTLTSLPNRLQLTDTLADALKYAEQWRTRCAFLMIDLDRFKSVNDSLGHPVGDKLLAQVAARLKTLMDDNKLCGRLGGDEFAIVIRDASEPRIVEKVAQQIISRLSEPYQVDNHTCYVGASVGSAIGPRDGTSVEELMRNADLALYKSKDTGGGEHFRFEPSLHALAEERRQLELSLREAINEDEFVLHYQPVVDTHTHDIVSFEALVRWNSKDHGFVSPAKFVPLAEDTRLIVPIGKWVMRKACMEARKWPEHIKVNVNVSPEQLLEPDFTNEVVEALAASGLRPERLEIEVTESIFLRDASIARAALEQVMALGCGVALDDFGTGYSSLGYLRKLRFSTIKVDKTFVQGAATNNPESLAIIRAVVAMAQSLDMTTTAEGAETEEEVAMITKLGCDKIQGYYFGRPMPADDALKLFVQSLRRTA